MVTYLVVLKLSHTIFIVLSPKSIRIYIFIDGFLKYFISFSYF